jgi:hypothetical protein
VTERNEAIERILLIVISLSLIFTFGRRLFFPEVDAEWPSPTVNFLTIASELGMLIGVVGLTFRRLKSTPRPAAAAGLWMVLPIIGTLAGLGLFAIRLSGGHGGELPARPTESERASSQRDKERRALIERKALTLNAPTGFGDAKWLMSPAEVKRVRRKSKRKSDGDLGESMRWLGRSAEVRYAFNSNNLLGYVIVTFQDSAREVDFAKTQNYLQSTHGKMPPPGKTKEDLLSSTYEQGGFEIKHTLSVDNTEQVMFSGATVSSRPDTDTLPPELEQMGWRLEASVDSYKRAEAEIEKTRWAQTAQTGAKHLQKLSRDDLREYIVKQRAYLDSVEGNIKILSEPGMQANFDRLVSLIESKGLMGGRERPQLDLRSWNSLRQMISFCQGFCSASGGKVCIERHSSQFCSAILFISWSAPTHR